MGLLCSAKLGVRLPFAPGASTAWEGVRLLPFAWARESRVGHLLNSASAALSLRQDGRGDGSSGAVARQTRLLPAARALCGRCEQSNLAACKALEGAARLLELAGISRLHSWCTWQQSSLSTVQGALVHCQARSASLRANPAWESAVTRRRRTARAARQTSKYCRHRSHGQPWRRPSASTTR